MSISLYLLQIDQLREIDAGVSEVGGFRLEDGALPPSFIINTAIADLESGLAPLWCSFFLFVNEKEGHAVGSGGFRGVPTNGRVEIGYGVAPTQRGKGAATAATLVMVSQAFAHAGVAEVFAETSVDNVPSRRVVEKAGFQHVGRRESQSDGLVDQWLIRRKHRA